MSPWMLCAVLLSLRAPRASTLSCLHPNGSAVDWFIIYKAPAVKKSNEVFTDPLEEGQFFVWTFPGASSWIWDRKLSIAKGGDSALGVTLEQVFSRNESLVKIFYNDERPVGTKSSTGGHTKGILGFDSSSGFWIVHSAPKFPASTSEYVFPSSALRFGQSFMCLSLNSTEYLDEVSHQLLYDEPHIYFSSQPDWALKLPYFADLVHKKSRRIQTPYYRTFQFTSFTDGVPFISFAKSSKFHKDLYVDLVSLFLKTSLWVESWTNGSGGRLNSSCTGIAYPVINVGVVRLVDADFHHTEDHSKWAIGGGWVCIGDINRMKSQRKRGGGTLCFKDARVWNIFLRSIESIEPCHK